MRERVFRVPSWAEHTILPRTSRQRFHQPCHPRGYRHSARLDSKESSVLLLHETRLRISISNPRIRNPFRRAHGSSNNSKESKSYANTGTQFYAGCDSIPRVVFCSRIPIVTNLPITPINHHLHCRRGKNEVLGSSFSQTELHS
jgi:hypothetical protein